MQKDKRILITGANGYIGSNIIDYLLENHPDFSIIAVDFKNDYINENALYINKNIFAENFIEELNTQVGEITACIHLAWQDGFNHNSPRHIENVALHYDFLTKIIKNGCDNISVMGTMHEVGYYEGFINEDTPCNPMSLYGIAKNALRQSMILYTQDNDINIKWLRGFYIIGDDERNQSIFTKIIQLEEEGRKTFPFTLGKNKYDFIEVRELAKQISLATIQNDITGIINVCTGTAVEIKDKVEEFIQKNNFTIKPEYGVFPARKYDSPAIWGDNKKIAKILEAAAL